MSEVAKFRGTTSASNTTGIREVSATDPLPVTFPAGANQQDSATSSTSGMVAADTTAGGTTIVAANSGRYFTQCQNNGAADVYFGAGTVTSSFLKVVPSGTFTWHSQEALKVLSSSGSCNIAFTDYINS